MSTRHDNDANPGRSRPRLTAGTAQVTDPCWAVAVGASPHRAGIYRFPAIVSVVRVQVICEDS
ncbi:hypothetical protein KRM28CT15_16800 [Krasilnikovia sp. M28-CT-15]